MFFFKTNKHADSMVKSDQALKKKIHSKENVGAKHELLRKE